MKWLSLLCLAIAVLLATPGAKATTTCSVTSISNLAFGTVDPTGTFVDTTATVNYSCMYSGALGSLYGTFITACIGLGGDDAGNLSPRTIIDGSGDRMQYQAYKDANRSAVWGPVNNATYPPLTFTRQIGILSNGATITGSLVIYGRVPAPQGNLSPGSYSGSLSGSLTGNAITWSYNEVLLSIGGYPDNCTSGGTTAAQTVAAPALTATASVVARCTLGIATDLDFGSVSGLLRNATDQLSLIHATCTNRAAYQIGLDNGQNASGTTRRMIYGTNVATYELYRDSQRTLRWGSTLNTDTAAGTGTGTEQTLTVYGRVPAQAPVQAGPYSDVITVTITY